MCSSDQIIQPTKAKDKKSKTEEIFFYPASSFDIKLCDFFFLSAFQEMQVPSPHAGKSKYACPKALSGGHPSLTLPVLGKCQICRHFRGPWPTYCRLRETDMMRVQKCEMGKGAQRHAATFCQHGFCHLWLEMRDSGRRQPTQEKNKSAEFNLRWARQSCERSHTFLLLLRTPPPSPIGFPERRSCLARLDCVCLSPPTRISLDHC